LKHAEWYVVIAVETQPTIAFPLTGLACGIDPGLKTAMTVAGEDIARPGQDGFEIDPGKPFRQITAKLTTLQQQLNRQTKANNPTCYDAKGEWINGSQKIYSIGMNKTQKHITKLYSRAANIRKDTYRKAARELLSRYDTIYMGDWKDSTPSQKRNQKCKRQKAGLKRADGVAAQQRGRNKASLDNALGIFRFIVRDMISQCSGKRLIEVGEVNTTRTCPTCKGLTGPTGLSGLGVRRWTCPNCGSVNHRDRASAWNILQVGVEIDRRTSGLDAQTPLEVEQVRPALGTGERKLPAPRS